MSLIIDIETKPNLKLIETYLSNLTAPKNYKDEEKIKQYLAVKKDEVVKTLSIDQDYSEIACIGVKEDDELARIVNFTELVELLKKHDQIITFNGKSFDLPIILKQAMRNKVEIPTIKFKLWLKKWSSENHIDLCEWLAMGGTFKSLDNYLQIYLGVKKKEIDFQTCTDEELKNHCAEDCENTYKLYSLFKQYI